MLFPHDKSAQRGFLTRPRSWAYAAIFMNNQINTSLDNICPYVRRVGGGAINWQGRTRKIYDHQLMFFCKGNGTYIVDGMEYEIAPGSLILIKPNVPHTIRLNDDYKYIWVHFDFFYREDVNLLNKHIQHNQNELFEDELPHTEWIREEPVFDKKFLFPDIVKLENSELVETLFSKLLFEFTNRNVAWSIRCKALVLDIFAEVLLQIFEEENIKTSTPHFKAFYTLITFIESNYFNNISLDDLAKLVNLTGNYVSRIFKKETGYSTIEYINYYRVKKAAELLAHADLKAYDIASMVGFNDAHYFSRIFKRFMGVSPRDYRRMLI